jgi:hypothetical protein
MNIAPWIPCTNCNAPIIVNGSYMESFFNGEAVTCSGCKAELDWWKVAQRAIKENFMSNQAFSLLEANSKLIKFTLTPNTRTCLNFTNNGIPVDAKILYINYTPQGGDLFPIEIHGNVPHRRIIGNEVWLYPMAPPNEDGGATEISAMVTWIEHSSDEIEFINITDAVEAYSNNQLLDAIVPANVAVESALSKLLSNFVSKFVGNKRVEDFLENSATYSSQLNVVLPLIVGMQGFPVLPDQIRGLLNKLRGYRNQIAHSGTTDKELTKEDTADALCAAIFGLRYIALIEARLKNA